MIILWIWLGILGGALVLAFLAEIDMRQNWKSFAQLAQWSGLALLLIYAVAQATHW